MSPQLERAEGNAQQQLLPRGASVPYSLEWNVNAHVRDNLVCWEVRNTLSLEGSVWPINPEVDLFRATGNACNIGLQSFNNFVFNLTTTDSTMSTFVLVV